MKKLLLGTLLATTVLGGCSTYEIKSDMAKNGVVNKTPDWYVEFDRTTKTTWQETASSVSPDMELAVKKSVMLAKAKLADRINGAMNNKTTITRSESGSNENLSSQQSSQDVVVNQITDTVVGNYYVVNQEVFSSVNKSYRAYVMIAISADDVERAKAQIEAAKIVLDPQAIDELANTATN